MFGLVFKISYKDWEALLHARDASAATLFSGEGATGWSARPNYHHAWGCAHGARCLEPTQKPPSLIELRRLVMTIVLPTLRFVAVGAQPASAMHPMGGETTNADRVVEVCTKTKKNKKS